MLHALPEKKLLESTKAPYMTDELRIAERETAQFLGKRGFLRVMKEARSVDFRSALVRVEHPTLVLCGAKEHPVNQKAARELATKIPLAELRIIPNAGHLWNLELPERFAGELSSFVQRTENAKLYR